MTHNLPSDNSQPGLFRDETTSRRSRTRGSMLWAAYADALGFISELVDDRGLRRRTEGKPLDGLMAWTRRVGGRGGVNVRLPSGTWSDDTQLRLCTSRALSSRGFDVEAFARVELPVWPSYALGGGRASKAAAAHLARPETLWYANTFSGWTDAGGNGAAMRVQPHAWVAPTAEKVSLENVLVDAVCTHGHPRALVGSCFHVLVLAQALETGRLPDRGECNAIVDQVQSAFRTIRDHPYLGSTWIGLWEQAAAQKLEDVWQATVAELRHALKLVAAAVDARGDAADRYQRIADDLRLREDAHRGSGVLTPAAALGLAWLCSGPFTAAVTSASMLGTDTDTIGTMAGALLGACHPDDALPEDPLDRDMLLSEADRLDAIAGDQDPAGHDYPDLLTWRAPPTQADALVILDSAVIVEGLGHARPLEGDPVWTPRRDFAWQWLQTGFGQTLLIKRRPELPSQGKGNDMAPPPSPITSTRRRTSSDAERANRTQLPRDRGIQLDAAVDFAREHLASDAQLGYTIRRVARDGTLADLVALVTSLRDDLRR